MTAGVFNSRSSFSCVEPAGGIIMASLAFAALLPLILAEDSPAAMLRGSQLATRNLERGTFAEKPGN